MMDLNTVTAISTLFLAIIGIIGLPLTVLVAVLVSKK